MMFKNAGYETILVYFGLDTVESAAIRVHTRVRLGGHDVPLETIRFNMEEGIKRVVSNFHIFDRIFFADTIVTGIAPIIGYYIKEIGKFELLDTKVDGLTLISENLYTNLYPNKKYYKKGPEFRSL